VLVLFCQNLFKLKIPLRASQNAPETLASSFKNCHKVHA
jgi:hypothetical protein